MSNHGTGTSSRPTRAVCFAAAFFFMIFAGQLTACGNGNSSSGGSGGQAPPINGGGYNPGSSAPAEAPYVGDRDAAPPTAHGPDVGCTLKWPRRATTQTSNVQENKYLDKIVACVSEDAQSMSLTNNSDVVWALYSPGSAHTEKDDAYVVEFHTLAASFYPYGFMAPNETVSLDAGPESVEWIIEPDLTTTWNANAFLLKQLTKKGLDALRTALTGKSAARQAVWDCTKGVYDVAHAVPKLRSPQYDPAQQISEVLGVATTTGKCATSWLTAQREVSTVPPWTQIVDETHNALKPAGELAEKSSTVKEVVNIFASLFCKVSPRGC